MVKCLFLCGRALRRSPTAAALAAGFPGVEADFAGLSPDADIAVSLDLVDWAEVIFVMEARQARRLRTLFSAALKGKRLVVLNIPDRYEARDPALVARLTPLLRAVLHR